MKPSIYFDTSTFNRIIKLNYKLQVIEYFKKENLHLFLSSQNLEEACYRQKNSEHQREVLELMQNLNGDDVYSETSALIKWEVDNFFGQNTQPPKFNIQISMENIASVPQDVLLSVKKLKKDWLASFKSKGKNRDELKPFLKDLSCKQFIYGILSTVDGKRLVVEVANRSSSSNKLQLESADNFLKKSYCTASYIMFSLALIYESLNGKNIDEGANIDALHTFYFPFASIFVTGDRNFYNRSKEVFEKNLSIYYIDDYLKCLK